MLESAPAHQMFALYFLFRSYPRGVFQAHTPPCQVLFLLNYYMLTIHSNGFRYDILVHFDHIHPVSLLWPRSSPVDVLPLPK